MEWDDIRVIVPQEAAAFLQELQASSVSMDDFCEAEKWSEWASIVAAWEKLAAAFTKATTVEGEGLKVYPHYHFPEIGEPSAYFGVKGVYKVTPAGEKYQSKIMERCFLERAE